MLPRERYINTMTFRTVDRVPLRPGCPRRSTLERWHEEGLPQDVSYVDYICDRLGLDPAEVFDGDAYLPVSFLMEPQYEEKVLEHTGNILRVQDRLGIICEISDQYDVNYLRNAIDFVTRRYLEFPVKNREDWLRMKQRYLDSEQRLEGLTEDWLQKTGGGKTVPLMLYVNGPFWQMRDWVGFENLCMMFYDEPQLVAEMCEFWCDFTLRVMDRIFARVSPDVLRFSEDMAYKAHSMISPAMTREFLQPIYRKWVEAVRRHGTQVIDVDSDGYIGDLIPVWLEAGITSVDPVEVAAGNDIVAYRRMYGKQLAFIGGIDKRAIAAGGDTLRKEVMRVVPPLLRDGGFIPSCDHGVPPDISLENFIEYTRMLAVLTGWL